MVSDVEIGSYLSGGMDTGAITAIVSKFINNLKTFTIGFDLTTASGIEFSFDEREKAEFMSYLYKSEQYEMVLKAGDMERALPALAYHLEEPRVGQSYPNFYAAKLASKFVKVVLSGTGGDELFGGYPWRYFNQATDNYEDYINRYFTFWQRLITEDEKYKVFSPIWERVKDVRTRDIFKGVFKAKKSLCTPDDYINNSFYFEAKTFLHGLLVVDDKLSMAHSLETRYPFLDNDLVDFAMKIPPKMKVRMEKVLKIDENIPGKKREYLQKTNDGKLVLRKAMEKYIPKEITEGIKQGFSAPDNSWFKGDSIELVRRTLLKKDSRIYNFLDFKSTEVLVKEHLEGKKNRRLLLWSLLNFEWWLNNFLK